MKNKFKLLLLCFVLIICSLLTGCDALDEMREHHATWTVAGKTDSITYKGVEYKQIVASPLPDPMYMRTYDTICVTEPDVPVLLSESRAVVLDISDNENFISGALFDDYTAEYDINSDYKYEYSYEEPTPVLYCKTDIYDNVMTEINEGIEYTSYGFEHVTGDLGDRKTELYRLTDEETSVINDIEETEEPIISYEISESYGYCYMFRLLEVSDDEHFAQTAYDVYMNALYDYYLVYYPDDMTISRAYKVPEKHKEIFDNFCNMGILMM